MSSLSPRGENAFAQACARYDASQNITPEGGPLFWDIAKVMISSGASSAELSEVWKRLVEGGVPKEAPKMTIASELRDKSAVTVELPGFLASRDVMSRVPGVDVKALTSEIAEFKAMRVSVLNGEEAPAGYAALKQSLTDKVIQYWPQVANKTKRDRQVVVNAMDTPDTTSKPNPAHVAKASQLPVRVTEELVNGKKQFKAVISVKVGGTLITGNGVAASKKQASMMARAVAGAKMQ